jgi:hypothetical protein
MHGEVGSSVAYAEAWAAVVFCEVSEAGTRGLEAGWSLMRTGLSAGKTWVVPLSWVVANQV